MHKHPKPAAVVFATAVVAVCVVYGFYAFPVFRNAYAELNVELPIVTTFLFQISPLVYSLIGILLAAAFIAMVFAGASAVSRQVVAICISLLLLASGMAVLLPLLTSFP